MAGQVALDCCEKETAYNPFYAQVLARLAQAGGLPRMALRHCIAERLRRCGNLSGVEGLFRGSDIRCWP